MRAVKVIREFCNDFILGVAPLVLVPSIISAFFAAVRAEFDVPHRPAFCSLRCCHCRGRSCITVDLELNYSTHIAAVLACSRALFDKHQRYITRRANRYSTQSAAVLAWCRPLYWTSTSGITRRANRYSTQIAAGLACSRPLFASTSGITRRANRYSTPVAIAATSYSSHHTA